VGGCRRGGPTLVWHSWCGGPALRCAALPCAALGCWRGGPAARRRRGLAVHMPKRLWWYDHRERPHRLATRGVRYQRGALRPAAARRRLAPSAAAAGTSTTTATSTTLGLKATAADADALPAQSLRRHTLQQVVPALLPVVVAHEMQQVMLCVLDGGAAIPAQG
jgi:hypothetical protein